MIDKGVVRETKADGTAVVEVTPHGGCRSCGHRDACCEGNKGGPVRMTALNRVGAKPGDRVTL